jgi:hypothetical protein
LLGGGSSSILQKFFDVITTDLHPARLLLKIVLSTDKVQINQSWRVYGRLCPRKSSECMFALLYSLLVVRLLVRNILTVES